MSTLCSYLLTVGFVYCQVVPFNEIHHPVFPSHSLPSIECVIHIINLRKVICNATKVCSGHSIEDAFHLRNALFQLILHFNYKCSFESTVIYKVPASDKTLVAFVWSHWEPQIA